MQRMLVMFAITAGAATAHASGWDGRICGQFVPSAAPQCVQLFGGVRHVEPSWFDEPMLVRPAAAAGARGKLIVYLHGHDGTPQSGSALATQAATAGFDFISLDYDYSRNYKLVDPSSAPQGAACTHPVTDDDGDPSCRTDLDSVCGCFDSCWGARWDTISFGGTRAGLPTVSSAWSINGRLTSVLSWIVANDPLAGARFASYFSGGQVRWGNVIVVGHSLGASLALYLSKTRTVSRAIMMSGAGDKLAPDGVAQWGTAHGCNQSGHDILGTSYDGVTPYHFNDPNTQCESTTTYAFGASNNLPNCKPSLAPVSWIANNGFTGGSGSWATPRSRIYGFMDADDKTCQWHSPHGQITSSQANWRSLALEDEHDLLQPAGWNNVGDWWQWHGIQSGGWHGVVSNGIDAQPQVCSLGSGHVATIGPNSCANTVETQHRDDVWRWMLTN